MDAVTARDIRTAASWPDIEELAERMGVAIPSTVQTEAEGRAFLLDRVELDTPLRRESHVAATYGERESADRALPYLERDERRPVRREGDGFNWLAWLLAIGVPVALFAILYSALPILVERANESLGYISIAVVWAMLPGTIALGIAIYLLMTRPNGGNKTRVRNAPRQTERMRD